MTEPSSGGFAEAGGIYTCNVSFTAKNTYVPGVYVVIEL